MENKRMQLEIYPMLFNLGEVAEVRGLGASHKNPHWEGWAGTAGVVSGYFDNVDDFNAAAAALDASGASGVYFTLNPCKPELIARAQNRLVAAGGKRPLTTDDNIHCIRWLPIDLDPKRPAGISASKEELEQALEMGKAIIDWLGREFGFPQHVGAFSGNGYHILYRLADLEVCDELCGADGLIARAIGALNHQFGGGAVDVDQKVYNPSRIWKLYGTMARKGDSTPERPHRKSSLSKRNPGTLTEVPVLSIDKLKALAQRCPSKGQGVCPPINALSKYKRPNHGHRVVESSGQLDVKRYLDHYGVMVKGVRKSGDADFFLLEECLFDQNHRGGEAAIVISSSPPYLTYQCFHSSCREKTWKDARRVISGDDPIAPFFTNYQPGKSSAWLGGKGLLATLPLIDGSEPSTVKGLPTAEEIDPQEFYQINGKRQTFNVSYMSLYLAHTLTPIVCTDGTFYKFTDGLWSLFKRSRLTAIIHRALKHRVQTTWYKTSIEALAAAVNREEVGWPLPGDMVNLANGMYDLKQRRLVEHHPDFGSRSQIPTAYDPSAQCPRWRKFMDEIFEQQEEKKLILQEFFGYILVPTCRFEKALFMYGTGANGKSTVLKVLEEIVGKNNISHLTLEDLSNRFQISYLRGKMLNVAAEVETKDRAGTEALKTAISGDTLEGDQKYGERVTFIPTAKFVFAMNSPPVISDKAHGFSRKVVVLNFTRRFEPHEMDRGLLGKLLEEKGGILAWAIEGAVRLLANEGFTQSSAIDQDTRNFMACINPVLTFLDERCQQGPEFKAPGTDLFNAYKEWAFEAGHRPLTKTRFYEQIVTNCEHVKEKKRLDWGDSRPWGFEGIGLSL